MDNFLEHIPDWMKVAAGVVGAYIIKPLWNFASEWLKAKVEIRKSEIQADVLQDTEQLKKLQALQTLANDANKNQIDVFDYFKSLFKGELDYVVKELDKVRESNQTLMEANVKLQLEFNAQKLEIESLKLQVKNFAISHPESPEPMWLKGLDGIMISLNDAYEAAFLIPQGFTRRDYIGFPDEIIWGNRISEMFKKFDLAARKDETDVVIEDVNFGNSLLENWVFIKMPYWKNGQLIGIAGRAIRKDIYIQHIKQHLNLKNND